MFFVLLQLDQDFLCSVYLVDKKSGKVDGVWELVLNLKELCLCYFELKCELIVLVDLMLIVLNKVMFDKLFEKILIICDIVLSVGFVSCGLLLLGNVVVGLLVMVLNVDNVDVNFFCIKLELFFVFVSQWEYCNLLSNWEFDELLKMVDLVYIGCFDFNLVCNICEKLLLLLSDIKLFQQSGVYVVVMNLVGCYSYSNVVMLFIFSDIGVLVYCYYNWLDVFIQSLENGVVQLGIEVQLFNVKGQILVEVKSDSQGYVIL